MRHAPVAIRQPARLCRSRASKKVAFRPAKELKEAVLVLPTDMSREERRAAAIAAS